jgi:integrase
MPRRTSKTQVPGRPLIDPSLPGEPRYRLHKRSRQAVVTLSGQDIYLGRHGTAESHERYRQAIAEWTVRGRRPATPDSAPYSVAELILDYIGHAESYYRTRDGQVNEAEIANIQRVLKPLRETFGLSAAADFGPKKLEVVREQLIADGLARRTVNRYVARVKHVFRWGVARETVPASVHHALSAFESLKRNHCDAPETEPVRAVPDALVDAIRPFVGRVVWGLVELQRCSGCRPGEAVLIRMIDIDVTGSVWLWKVPAHKNQWRGTERVVALGPRAQRIIREFQKPDLSSYLFSPGLAEQERRAARHALRKTPAEQGNNIGTNRKIDPRRKPGERYTSCSYRRAIQRGCELAFPPPTDLSDEELRAWRHEHSWVPNQLRHSAATRIRKEFSLEHAQTVLGHTEPQTTLIYAERNARLAVEVAARIG